MRQRELVEFRTPQHPSLGNNHWGAASPLLARNIPKESLEQRYLKLNSIRTRDEIFPAQGYDFNYLTQTHANKHQPDQLAAPTPSRSGRGFFSKLTRKENVALGSNSKKKRWFFPRWNPRHRWPQGW